MPFYILGIGSFERMLVQGDTAFFRVYGVSGKLPQCFHRHKYGRTICVYRYQEAFAGHQASMGAEQGAAFYMYGIVPVAFCCFKESI